MCRRLSVFGAFELRFSPNQPQTDSLRHMCDSVYRVPPINSLRHDLNALWVSLLAEANYCEQKAALSVMYPKAEPESEEMRAGAEAHIVLEAEAEKIER